MWPFGTERRNTRRIIEPVRLLTSRKLSAWREKFLCRGWIKNSTRVAAGGLRAVDQSAYDPPPRRISNQRKLSPSPLNLYFGKREQQQGQNAARRDIQSATPSHKCDCAMQKGFSTILRARFEHCAPWVVFRLAFVVKSHTVARKFRLRKNLRHCIPNRFTNSIVTLR